MADVFRKATDRLFLISDHADGTGVLLLEGCEHKIKAEGVALERFNRGELVHCLECSRDKTREIWREQNAPPPIAISPDVLSQAAELLESVCVCGELDSEHVTEREGFGACGRDGCLCEAFRPAPLRAVLAAEDAVIVAIGRADLERIIRKLSPEAYGITEDGQAAFRFVGQLQAAAATFDQERRNQDETDDAIATIP